MAKMTQAEYDKMVKLASEHESPKCLDGEVIFFAEDTEAFGPGHIYSRDGLAEFRISRLCEYHFDEAFAEDEE